MWMNPSRSRHGFTPPATEGVGALGPNRSSDTRMRARSERGAGSVGCVVVLLAALVLGYLSFKVVPVYIDSMNFDEDVAREASHAGANFWADEKIKQDVLQMGNFRNFRLTEEDITVSRSGAGGGELRINVQYSIAVVFPGYVHTLHFRSRAGSIVGSF